MKKICLMLVFIMIMTLSVYAGSRNRINESGAVKKAGEAVSAQLIIQPSNEVATGAYVEIEFENAVVFSSAVINGTGSTDEIGYNGKGVGYQYKGYRSYTWNGSDNFYTAMSGRPVSYVPYKITRLSDYKIRVSLCNIPGEYADKSLTNFNGSIDAPYYSIPLPVYVKEDGFVRVKLSGKVNDTSLSYGNYVFNQGNTQTTETVTEETTEAVTEETTESVKTENKINSVQVTIGSSIMVVNGENIILDGAPYIQAGSWAMLVPLRAVSLALADGYSGNGSINTISWNEYTKTAIITYNGNMVSFTAGSGIVNINGEDVYMDDGVTAEINDGRMYVPFRVLGEALGAEVSWDSNTKTAFYN